MDWNLQTALFRSIAWQAGNKDEGLMFLLTDSQITNERFLIYINDLLASGNIPDLFAVDEVDSIVSDSGGLSSGEGCFRGSGFRRSCSGSATLSRTKSTRHVSVVLLLH